MMRWQRVVQFAAGALLATLASSAQAQTTVTVTVTNGGVPAKGAFVALVGATHGNSLGGITGTDGTHVFEAVANDTYTITASAPGTKVGTATITTPSSTTATVAVVSSATAFSGLGAYGAQTGSVAADARSGIFYMSTTAVPSVYRTHNYGGSWAPVTLSSDDETNGVDAGTSFAVITTSGYPGEIAGIAGGRLYYSRDFGVSWKSLARPSGMPDAGVQVMWARAGAAASESMMLLAMLGTDPGATPTADMWYADMSVASPVLSKMATSYKAGAGDKVSVAGGATQPYIAVASATGSSVKLYQIDATPSGADASITVPASAPSGAPTFVRLGGPATGPSLGGSAAPSVLLVYTNDTDAVTTGNQAGAIMSTYDGTAWRSTTATEFRGQENDGIDSSSTFNSGPNSCAAGAGSIGSLAPRRLTGSGVTSTFGTVSQCWVEQRSADFSKLIVRPVNGISNNTGAVYDAGWGGASGNLVMMSADGGKGMVKSDRWSTTLNRPEFPQWPVVASGGFSTAPYSTTRGGVSIQGINAAVITDTAFQPGSAQNMVATMSFSGGGRVVGTVDGGVTGHTLESRGAGAVDWWTWATTGWEWILTGSRNQERLLAASGVSAEAPFSTSTTMTQLTGTSTLNLTQPGGSVIAIVGMPGSNKAVVAAVTGGTGQPVTESAISYVTLTPVFSGSPAVLTSISATVSSSGITIPANGNSAPVAMAYCPTTGSNAAVADRLFIAVSGREGRATDGYVLSVTGASTATPASATQFAAGFDFTDVRVDCPSGTMYAGARVSGGESGVLRATVSGSTLGTLGVVAMPDLGASGSRGRIEALDISPTDVNRVVAVAGSGDVFQTVNGGTTWTLINSSSREGCDVTVASCGRGFGSETPGDIEIAPASGGSDLRWRTGAAPAAATARAVFGSASGLYSTRLSSAEGSGGGGGGTPGPTVTVNSNQSLTITWTAVSGASKYLLYPYQGGTPLPGSPFDVGAGTTITTGPSPLPNGTYTIAVAAVVGGTTGAQSSQTSFTIGSGGGGGAAPGTPGTPTVTVAGGAVTITWTPASGTVTSYRLAVTQGGVPLPGSPFDVGPSTSVGPATGLPAGTYTVTVTALNGSTPGTASAAATFTVP